MSTNPLNDISRVYLEKVAVDEAKQPFPAKKVAKQMEKARKGSVYGKPFSNEPAPKVSDTEKKETTRYSKMFHASEKAKREKQEADKARRSPTFYKDTHPASAPKMKKANEEVDIVNEAEGSYGATPKAYSAASKTKMTAKRKPFLKKMLSRTNPANRTDPYGSPRKGLTADDRERARAGASHGVGTRQDHDYPSEGPGGVTKSAKKLRKQKALGELGEASHLETDMKKRREENEKAVEDMKKTAAYKSMAAAAAKKFDEALDPVGQEDADVDNDGKKGTNADKYLMKRRKAIGKAISTQEAKEVKRWWDDDGDGKGYEEGEVSGKFKKKKSVKEGFSNWREDLSEVVNGIEKDKKITEKKVDNKIEINPKLDLGEAVENLGGFLIEMVEIDEVDFIVESVYDELLDEGYEEDDIEEAIEYALIEAKVTFGHDTPTGQKKRGNLVKSVGRLARQKLSSKVRGAKKAAAGAVARGARKVAKGALKVARKVEGGDKSPSAAHTGTRKASTYRGAGAGQKEKVSSGSYTPPAKKKAEKPSDPWEGSATTPPKAKAKTKKAAAPKAAAPKAKATTATKRKRKSKLDDLLASVRADESVNLGERTLSSAETKEKEKIVKSMKSKASDFESRYPGRGKEVMYATATKMAKKIAEQALELQPKTQSAEKPDQQQKKTQQQKDRMRQQEVQILQRKLQAMRSAPRGSDPSITT